ncbi:hypothetical protein [Chitinophaga agri]|uniref:MoxR-vWA-beta-propeller ternary system domain-containing protein n=1 Tax=Chitinophaga agri TaxID=2703787 RepID=A0A6B9ZCA6_9BACT|nr:hypothetical protein [Chitinophaga agri]QHS59797.1 hypothetical protein GWR21_09390 [Chitinophaga agri]
MLLQLQPDIQTRHKTAAAFLRGNSPEQWFREMNEWQIPLQHLTGLLLPAHKNTVEPGGLLVIFKNDIPAPDKIIHAYGVINDNLFIPVNAQIIPAVTAEEMKELLIWHRQVMHPGIGFIGYEARDERPLSSFITPGSEVQRSWGHAHPGLPLLAPLTSIGVARSQEEEISDMLGIYEQRPLDELPEDDTPLTDDHIASEDRRSFTDRELPSFFRYNPLGIMLAAILAGLAKLFSFGGRTFMGMGRGGFSRGEGDGGHTFGRSRKRNGPDDLKNLQTKRDRELERLLRLFDTNLSEALKFAIPLQDNGAGRGTASPSARLGERSTDFNMGSLFSNRPVDGWSVGDDHGTRLRQKYEEQAKKATEDGNHRQAAYIYAHLLGDLNRAAKVLEWGRFYHEAATLYLNHLKQPLEAARCYEEGGLLLDAIRIYKEQEKFEKTGDLLMQLSQTGSGQQYYQLATDRSLRKKDFLDAARIQHDKRKDPDAACETLLKGWQMNYDGVKCLNRYLKISNELDKERLAEKIELVYTEKTAPVQLETLLDTLIGFRPDMNDAAKDTTTRIAFEVISPLVEKGKEEKLEILKKVLPGDKQLSSDIQRYLHRNKYPDAQMNMEHSFKLREDIEWCGATSVNNQLVFVGMKETRLFVVRMLPNGRQQYYSWESKHLADNLDRKRKVMLYPYFPVSGDNRYYRQTMFLQTDRGVIDLGKLVLPAEKPFEGTIVLDTTDYSIHGDMQGITTDKDEQVITLMTDKKNGQAILRDFHQDEELQQVRCYNAEDNSPVIIPKRIKNTVDLQLYGNEPFFTWYGNRLYRFNSIGETEILKTAAAIDNLAIYQTVRATTLVVSTAKGCYWVLDDKDGFRVITSNFTAEPHTGPWKMLSDERLVMANKTTGATVYEFNNKNGGRTVQQLKTASAIRFILMMHHPDQVFLVDDKGRTSLHEINASGR